MVVFAVIALLALIGIILVIVKNNQDEPEEYVEYSPKDINGLFKRLENNINKNKEEK